MDEERDWAPGLSTRKRKNGIAYYWVARDCSRLAEDYEPKTVRLHQTSADERAKYCRRLYGELMEWLGDRDYDPIASFNGTVHGLVQVYQLDPQSPYHGVKANSRKRYDDDLGYISSRVGKRKLSELTARDFLRWYDKLKEPDEPGGAPKFRKAHGVMTQIRMIINWGVALELPHCERLALILSKLRFKLPKRRKETVTYDQARSIIELAHERGRGSIALGQALQFELTLRQTQVTGQWLPFDGAVPDGGLIWKRTQWQDGLLWSDISPDMILRKTASKTEETTGAEIAFDLKLYPLVMEEVRRVPPEQRVGPMIIDESTGVPYKHGRYSRIWRKLADQAGVPKNVWNRDSRAGGISEAAKVAGLDAVRHHAQHSDTRTTALYSRDTLGQTSKVARLRVANREAENKE